jgi:hypothetical protein
VVSPRRAAEHRAVFAGAVDLRIGSSIGRPDGTKDKRTFGRRSQVERSGSSQEGAASWEATPELVSQDRERVHWGLRVFRGPGYEYRQILRSAQWGLAAMPAPISFGQRENPGAPPSRGPSGMPRPLSTWLRPGPPSAQNNARHPTIRPTAREHSAPRFNKADNAKDTKCDFPRLMGQVALVQAVVRQP